VGGKNYDKKSFVINYLFSFSDLEAPTMTDVRFENILDEYLQKVPEKSHSGKFRVSSAGLCYQKRLWEREGKEPTDPVENRMLRVFKVGEVFHTWLQNMLEDMGYLVLRELELEDDYRVGRLDAVVEKDGKRILYDFKTVHSRKFIYKEEIDIHYCMQAWTYKLMLEEQYGMKADSVRVLYISRDDLLLKDVEVEKVIGIEKMVEEDWNGLIKASQGKGIIIAPKQDWECTYCVYRSACSHRQEVVKDD